jgi:hypothetical protein
MSIPGQRRQISDLLEQLHTPILSRSHNSVSISFKQMLSYIDRVIEPDPTDDIVDPADPIPDDILALLKTYRSMADAFYIQFELSLLSEVKKLTDLRRNVKAAIRYIGNLQSDDPGKNVLGNICTLLQEDYKTANKEYRQLLKEFPTLLQSAVDKLREEWQRLNVFVVARQRLTADERLDRSLKAVVEVAAHSVGIEAERVVIVPGTTFALYFFTYLDNFAVLTIPIYSVQAPWEWSIFWHELAGYKVRRLEKSETIEAIRKKLIAFHDAYKTADAKKIDRLLDSIVGKNQYMRNYLIKQFSQERPILDDLGGFDYQFEKMIPGNEKFETFERIKTTGWCVDWFKELFEDAWSVLAIGEPFLKFFSDVLRRHGAKDNRHPPAKIRLSVAKELLKLVDPNTQIMNDPDPLEGAAAKQILNFMSLLRASTRHYEKPNADVIDLDLVWQGMRDEILNKVRGGIQVSIESWYEKSLNAENPTRRVAMNAKNFLDVLTDPELEKLLSQLPRDTNHNRSRYTALLNDALGNPKTYRQLLELSFYDADFGAETVHTIGIESVTFSYVGPLPTPTNGTVSYKVDNLGPFTTIPSTWNEFFGTRHKVSII